MINEESCAVSAAKFAYRIVEATPALALEYRPQGVTAEVVIAMGSSQP
jgi:hypothetical protein